MRTPKQIKSLCLKTTCDQIGINAWEKLMHKTTKANGALIRKHIKEHLPDLYEGICLDFHNPYEHKSVKKDGLFVYVHSGIEYFLEYR